MGLGEQIDSDVGFCWLMFRILVFELCKYVYLLSILYLFVYLLWVNVILKIEYLKFEL